MVRPSRRPSTTFGRSRSASSGSRRRTKKLVSSGRSSYETRMKEAFRRERQRCAQDQDRIEKELVEAEAEQELVALCMFFSERAGAARHAGRCKNGRSAICRCPCDRKAASPTGALLMTPKGCQALVTLRLGWFCWKPLHLQLATGQASFGGAVQALKLPALCKRM